jgi:hypothetical protein
LSDDLVAYSGQLKTENAELKRKLSVLSIDQKQIKSQLEIKSKMLEDLQQKYSKSQLIQTTGLEVNPKSSSTYE